MKKTFFALILSISLFFLETKTFAQQTDYFDTTNYLVELNKYLSPVYSKHPEVKTEYQKLAEKWSSIGEFHFGITYVSNSMFYKRVRPYPDFYNYLGTLNTLLDNQNMDYYREWEVGLLSLLELPSTDFRMKTVQSYLSFSLQLIRDSILYKNNSVTWKIKTTDYEIGNHLDSGVYVFFANPIDLYCYNTSNIDSFVIHNVRGTCYPVRHHFWGEQGRITWEKYGYPADMVFAKFTKFHLKLSKGEFIDSTNAVYTNQYFKLTQIPGVLTVKLVLGKSENVSPKFESKDIVIIKNPVPETKVTGKILVKGKSFFVIGSQKQQAQLFINYKDKMYYKHTRAIVRSSNIKIIKDSVLSSGSAKVTFFYNGNSDSLYHPNVAFSYQKSLYHRKKIKIKKDNKSKKDTIKWVKESIFQSKWFKDSLDVFNDTSYFIIISAKPKNTLGVYDSYHKMEIFIDKMVWKKNDSLVYFITTKSSNTDYLKIYSDNYFDIKLFEKYTEPGLVYINHLREIKNFYDELEEQHTSLTVDLYREHLATEYNRRYTESQVTNLFQNLYFDGFLDLNKVDTTAVPTGKLYRYVENEKRLTFKPKQNPKLKKTDFADFDRLSIISQKGRDNIRKENIGTNAILNLNTNILNVKYLKPIKFAPTVSVKTPEINILADRNLEFNGVVRAGGLVFYNKEDTTQNDSTAKNNLKEKTEPSHFLYNYKANKIEIIKPAYMRMQYIDADSTNRILGVKTLTTEVKNIQGDIIIDKPDNKSLVDREEKYPIFKSKRKAQINFKLPSEYNKDFSFDFDNFDMDNLDFITQDSLKFKGTLTTGLFDPMKITVSVMQGKDGYFLGFNEGFGKGCVKDNKKIKSDKPALYLKVKDAYLDGCLFLNDEGLFANGIIHYKSAEIYGKNFQLLPNQIKGHTDSIIINDTLRKENIPYIYAKNLQMDWTADIVLDIKKNTYVQIYNEGDDYNGKLKPSTADDYGSSYLAYSYGTCYGGGDFEFKDAVIQSDTINLFAKKFDTPKCDFSLKNANSTVFNTKNLNGNVDMNEKQGFFQSNNDTSAIVFKRIDYVCFMDHFLWKIGEGIVDIGGTMGQDSSLFAQNLQEKDSLSKKGKKILLYGTILQSLNDGLRFNAKTTSYSYGKTEYLRAKQVREMYVSDAKIEPSTDVIIRVNGYIDTLHNVTVGFPYPIDQDTTVYNYRHIFNHATVKIKNKYAYTASNAEYTYPYKLQIIKFKISSEKTGDKIKVGKKSFYKCYSLAKDKYKSGEHYRLNPYFVTTGDGDITIKANEALPRFSGFAKIDTANQICSNFKINEFLYPETSIDYTKVILPINMKNKSRHDSVFNGIVWESKRINRKTHYFINDYFIQQQPRSDKRIFTSAGKIYYNEINQEYRISTDTSFLFGNWGLDTIQGNYFAFDKNNCIVHAQGGFNLFNYFEAKNDILLKTNFAGTYTHKKDENAMFEGVLTVNVPIYEDVMKRLKDTIRTYCTLVDSSNFVTKYLNIAVGKENTIMLRDNYLLPNILKTTFVFNDVKFQLSPNGDTLYSVNENDELQLITLDGKYVNVKVKAKIVYLMTETDKYFLIIFKPTPQNIYAFRYSVSDGQQQMHIFLDTPDDNFDTKLANTPEKERKIGKNFIFMPANNEKFTAYFKNLYKF